ncbi:MAG: helix-turn-helix domain-containing protein [Oceanospirillaceae bacterium]|nr:helix-turn-helix domain-containing protein [Oceanospirillaceae bacterium]
MSEKKKEDMHPADVMAALKKRGLTMSAVAKEAGYKYPQSLRSALDRKWPKGERIIAAALGMKPEDIWPSRYLESPASKINIPHRSVA